MGIKRKGLWLRRNEMSNKNRPKKIDDKYFKNRFTKTYQPAVARAGDFFCYEEDRLEPF